MTARQPRRTRRRAPATALPRPAAAEPLATPLEPARTTPAATRRTTAHRQHHVTTDYGYIHKDLLTVAGVGVVVIGFIVGMSFIL